MVFSSSVFLFHFLPVLFLAGFFIKKEYANYFLILGSLIFYAWGEPVFVLIMIGSIIVNWLAGNIIEKSNKKKLWLVISIVLNLGTLVYYKYCNFFVSTVNDVFGRQIITQTNIALPIGISFFTFQAMSYVIDVYRGEVNASKKIANVALYISFFPQLIAGPIVRYKDINKRIENREMSWSSTAEGFRRFIYGLGKKVLIANTLGICVDKVYSYNNIDCASAWISALAYMFQIYYDFSGYSDMAIGLGKMFGFTFLENFNYPYLSHSISEFWRRWHISLGTWFREYLYIPLGGNKKGKARTYINLFIVFFLTGLWHGANASFIVWGLYHGFFSIVERLGFKNILKKFNILSMLYCFLIVLFGWVLFRAPDTATGLRNISAMLTPWRTNTVIPMYDYITSKTIFVFILAVIGAGPIQKIVPIKLKNSIPEAIFCIVILLLSIASIASNTYNPFIYFQF